MSEHDEAGSAWTFPPLPPPPPPQPAARSASTVVRPISAASNGLLLTLPPQSPIPVLRRTRREARAGGDKYRGIPLANVSPNRRYSGQAPKWRNWQTRRTQNPVGREARVG